MLVTQTHNEQVQPQGQVSGNKTLRNNGLVGLHTMCYVIMQRSHYEGGRGGTHLCPSLLTPVDLCKFVHLMAMCFKQ